MTRQNRSKFIKVKCKDCSNEQIIFNKPSTVVKCNVCGTPLANPRGGLGELVAELVEEVQ